MGQLGDAVVQYPVASVVTSRSLGGSAFPQPTVMRTHQVANSASFAQVPHPGGLMTGSLLLAQQNLNRVGLKIWNSGSALMQLGFGHTVSATGSFDWRVAADSGYEHAIPVYSGPVFVSWTSGSLSGNLAFVTETSLV